MSRQIAAIPSQGERETTSVSKWVAAREKALVYLKRFFPNLLARMIGRPG
jgi:hypothetical protein